MQHSSPHLYPNQSVLKYKYSKPTVTDSWWLGLHSPQQTATKRNRFVLNLSIQLMFRFILFSFLLFSFACSGKDAKPLASETTNTASRAASEAPLSISINDSSTTIEKPEKTSPPELKQKTTIREKSPSVAAAAPKAKAPTSSPEEENVAATNSHATDSHATNSHATDSHATASSSIAAKSETEAAATQPLVPNHQAFDALLQQYVDSEGQVNYSAFKKAEDQLDAYLHTLALAIPGEGWTKNEALAYWMNAYNAATLQLILQNWPLQSIMDLHGGKPWDVKWITLGGKTYSLNQIEHQIIRPQFKDARIHFAVNCAAQSCPPLYNRAFRAQGLGATLDRLSKAFINKQKFNKIAGQNAQISKLFDWYQEDFGDVRSYLNTYLNSPLGEDIEISYLDYNWAINGR